MNVWEMEKNEKIRGRGVEIGGECRVGIPTVVFVEGLGCVDLRVVGECVC